jgi:hypothetical protein
MRIEYPKKYWWLVLIVVPIIVAILRSPILDWIFHTTNQESIKVSSKGIGYPPVNVANPTQRRNLAERAAKTVALRNLAEEVKAKIISTTKTQENVITKDEIELRVETIIKSARTISSIELPGGGVEITMEAEVLLNEK